MKTALIFLCAVVGALGATTNGLSWRIVGGQVAKEGQFPYQISLKYLDSHSCGGSILDQTTIICAAHCVDGRSASYMTVVAGVNQLNAKGDVYQVKSYVVHPDYDGWDITNDISIIKLASPIQYSDKVLPVKLRQTVIPGDQDAVLSGWGTTSYPGDTPNDLQWIELKTLSYEDCKAKHSSSVILESEVCTLTKKGEGACHGDSGGPLVDGNGEQIGIVSWGNPCANGVPDVFTRVTSFLDWIEENRK